MILSKNAIKIHKSFHPLTIAIDITTVLVHKCHSPAIPISMLSHPPYSKISKIAAKKKMVSLSFLKNL